MVGPTNSKKFITWSERPTASFGWMEQSQVLRLLVVVRGDLVDDVDVLHRPALELRFRQIQTLRKEATALGGNNLGLGDWKNI